MQGCDFGEENMTPYEKFIGVFAFYFMWAAVLLPCAVAIYQWWKGRNKK